MYELYENFSRPDHLRERTEKSFQTLWWCDNQEAKKGCLNAYDSLVIISQENISWVRLFFIFSSTI